MDKILGWFRRSKTTDESEENEEAHSYEEEGFPYEEIEEPEAEDAQDPVLDYEGYAEYEQQEESSIEE
jgi:hypothetical protein